LFIHVFANLPKNALCIICIQHSSLGIALAKPAAIRQLNSVFRWQTANETPRQYLAIGTDLNLFAGDFIGRQVKLARNGIPADGAIIRARCQGKANEHHRKEKAS
jgi:hypothetical protein